MVHARCPSDAVKEAARYRLVSIPHDQFGNRTLPQAPPRPHPEESETAQSSWTLFAYRPIVEERNRSVPPSEVRDVIVGSETILGRPRGRQQSRDGV